MIPMHQDCFGSFTYNGRNKLFFFVRENRPFTWIMTEQQNGITGAGQPEVALLF